MPGKHAFMSIYISLAAASLGLFTFAACTGADDDVDGDGRRLIVEAPVAAGPDVDLVGTACVDTQGIDLDATQAGLQLDCAATIALGAAVDDDPATWAALPSCAPGSATPCWYLEATTCDDGQPFVVTLSAATAVDGLARLRCRLP